MKKRLTKRQKQMMANEIKAISYYAISRVLKIISLVAVIIFGLWMLVDMDHSSISTVSFMTVLVGCILVACVSNQLSHWLSVYLFNHGVIRKDKVTKSFTDYIYKECD